MNQKILIAVIALLIGGFGGYLIADRDEYEMNDMDHSMMMSDYQKSDVSQMGNMNGMDHSAMMVSSERAFIEGMIPHHQEAVDTAKEVIERGATTPEIKQLVENIVVAQEAEIVDMKEWYFAWYGEAYQDTGEYSHMMRELSDLSGAQLDQVFLEDMIMHHMGAIMMARSVQPHIEHQEIENLTNAIVETQTAEIELMQRLLTEI